MYPDIWADPNRIFNQDETAFELSEGSVKVLAKKGTRNVPGRSSGSRSHETLSVTASAAGNLVWPRLVLKGIRDVSKKHFSCLQPGIKTGSFRFSYTETGFVNKDVFCKIILDLDEYLSVNKTPRPILLLIDGATCHISLKARDMAKDTHPSDNGFRTVWTCEERVPETCMGMARKSSTFTSR